MPKGFDANQLKALDLGLTKDQCDNLFEQLQYRRKYVSQVNTALMVFKPIFKYKKGTNLLLTQLNKCLESAQGLFLAMMEEAAIICGSYHSSLHANEMINDIYHFVYDYLSNTKLYSNDEVIFYANLAATMGAAHDIIQNMQPYENELVSEKLLVKFLNHTFLAGINSNSLTTQQLKAFQNFKQHILPFMAKEAITHGTYLLMGDVASGLSAPKRDFGSVLNSIEEKKYGRCSLDPITRAMQTALSICDVRRSELSAITAQHRLLNSLPSSLQNDLNFLLHSAGLLDPEETIQSLKFSSQKFSSEFQRHQVTRKLDEVEGFLIRLGQNFRMQTENLYKLNLGDKDKHDQALLNMKILSKIRKLPDIFNIEAINDCISSLKLTPFFNALVGPYSESAFAQGLAKSGEEIVSNLHDQKDLQTYVKAQFDQAGWLRHSNDLHTLYEASESWDSQQWLAMKRVIGYVAAKQPGLHFAPQHLQALRDRLSSLQTIQSDMGIFDCSDLREYKKLLLLNGQKKRAHTISQEILFSNLSGKSIASRIQSLSERVDELIASEFTVASEIPSTLRACL